MKRIVAMGEIMGRFSPPGYQRFGQCMPGSLDILFAGAEASVAMSIAHLGGDAAFVTALPDHSIADACIAAVRAVGVDTRHIVRTRDGRLGLYFLEAGVNQRPGKVIYDREGSSIAITPPQAYDWDAILEGADWLVISGITPAISRNGLDVAMAAVDAATKHRVRVLCDFNYRGKLWHWSPPTPPRKLAIESIRLLLPKVDLLIAGTDEILELIGDEKISESHHHEIAPETSFAEAATNLSTRFPNLAQIASTYRRTASASRHELGGMLWGRSTDSQPPDQVHWAPELRDDATANQTYAIEHVVDRIGTGDAFTAGLLFALTTPELSDPKRAIAFATAAFCLSHSIAGDFNFTNRQEIEELLAGDSSGRVQR
ncbi:MAG TPA: sugar kinase [Planctomycetaceae bacterium]|nr:sugar kinase [Planctomycetaceae bacterium]